MTRQALARLMSYGDSEERVYVRIRDAGGAEKGLTVYDVTADQLLSFLIEALKTAGYQGSWRADQPSILSQIKSALRSFDPVSEPCCYKCRAPLKIGQELIPVKTENRPRIYHKSCYEAALHLACPVYSSKSPRELDKRKGLSLYS